MAKIGFNTADAPEPTNDFDPIPAGDYPMRVINSEMKDTKDGTGKMLVLEMDITDGPCAGRKHWERFNLVNKNAQAVEIAQRSLAQLCLAVGKVSVDDSEELHMLPFIAKMKVTPPKDEYAAGNQIAAYKEASGNGGAARQTAATAGSTGSSKSAASPSSGSKPKAYKNPDDGKWYDENENQIPFFKLSGYEKVEG